MSRQSLITRRQDKVWLPDVKTKFDYQTSRQSLITKRQDKVWLPDVIWSKTQWCKKQECAHGYTSIYLGFEEGMRSGFSLYFLEICV